MNNLNLFMNKKINQKCIAALAFGLGFLQLFTSAAADPLVQFPTGNAAWTVDITYPNDQVPTATGRNSQRPKRIEVTQSDKARRTRITLLDGQTMEEWTIPNMFVVFKEYPNGGVFPVENNNVEFQIENSSMPRDISAFSWVTPASLQEKTPVSFRGQMCYHYAGTSKPLSHGGSTDLKREAWIDSKSLLPIALKTESTVCVFTFLPLSTPVEMPPKFQKEVAYYKHVMGLP